MNSRRELTHEQNTHSAPLLIVLSALAVGIFVGVMITRCSWHGKYDSTLLQRLQQRDIVRVGFANEAPFAFLDDQGNLTGEAPEVARVIFRKMGINHIEGVLTDFALLIPDLKARRFDMIAAGMYITPARSKEISFSLPTYTTGPGLLVRDGNPKNLHSYVDFRNHPGAVIAVMKGAVEEDAARAAGLLDNRIFVVPDIDTGVRAVRTGRADGFAMTRVTAGYLANRFDMADLDRAEPFSDGVDAASPMIAQGAFGFRLEDRELQQEFNRHLAEFIGTPEHRALVEKFGIDAASIPGTQTTMPAASQQKGTIQR